MAKSNGTFKDPRKVIAPPAPCKEAKHTMMGSMPKKMKKMMSK